MSCGDGFCSTFTNRWEGKRTKVNCTTFKSPQPKNRTTTNGALPEICEIPRPICERVVPSLLPAEIPSELSFGEKLENFLEVPVENVLASPTTRLQLWRTPILLDVSKASYPIPMPSPISGVPLSRPLSVTLLLSNALLYALSTGLSLI